MNSNGKKILFICPVFPPYKSWWWQSQVARDFAKWLHNRWYDVMVLTTRFDWLESQEDKEWINIFRFATFSKFLLNLWLYNPKWYCKWLKNNINNYNLVFIHDIYTLYWFVVAKFCKKYNIPYILMPHGMWNISKQKDKVLVKKVFSFLFSNFASKNANKILFCSENEKRDYEISYTDSIVITNWIDQKNWLEQLNNVSDDDIKNFRKKYELWDRKIIFSMWRLVKAKRFDKTISYLSSFLKEHGEYILLIVWPNWGELENLKLQIESNWLDKNVKIIEWLFWKEKYVVYKIAELFVLSSDLEGFPIVLCEAISSKIPCLISEWCNISWSKNFVEVFDNENDFMIKLNSLINMKIVDDSYYKSFDIKNTINKLNNLIITIIG